MWTLEDENFPNRNYTYFQFGIQRTGTTILERAIKDAWGMWKANDFWPNDINRTPPAYDQYVWKHSIDYPDHYTRTAPTVLIYKNPYTWAESMAFRKGSGNGGWSFTYGHEAEEHMYPQPNHWNTISVPRQGTTNFGQLMYTYKHWFGTWLAHAEQYPESTMLIKYEDLLVEESRNRILREIGQKFGWPDLGEDHNFTFVNHVGSSQPMTPERTQYYIDGRPTDDRIWANNGRYIKSIRDILGVDLIERLGYQVL